MQKDTYNRGGFIAFLFSMAFSLLFFVYVTVVHPGINLKEIPEPLQVPEQTVAGGEQAKDIDMSKVDKPWAESADVAAHGAKIFANNCAVCHGPKGLGDGPAGMSLNPRPRNFVEGKWKVGGDSVNLFKTVSGGIPGSSMASFAHLPATDRWSLVQFVRSITHNKIKDDPAKVDAFGKTAK
jgi:mono/diheme cytochrome c family protein